MACGAIVAALGLAAPAAASVDLLWSPTTNVVGVGEIFTVQLIATSDLPDGQKIAAMDVILSWDPSVVRLIRVINNGPYTWLSSGFPADGGLDGLNNTFADGNALYQALGRLGTPALVTPAGLHVTTFEWEAVGIGEVTVEILPEYGQFSESRVFDGVIPGLEVHDELGNFDVSVKACAEPDADEDGDVDLVDFAAFQRCFGAAGVEGAECRCAFDADNDGDIDLADYSDLGAALTGPTQP
jgi:hypothetical protein